TGNSSLFKIRLNRLRRTKSVNLTKNGRKECYGFSESIPIATITEFPTTCAPASARLLRWWVAFPCRPIIWAYWWVFDYTSSGHQITSHLFNLPYGINNEFARLSVTYS